jgi:hypothetical protein
MIVSINKGRCGVGAGNKLEVYKLNTVPAPEVLQSKTSRPHRFSITPLEGVASNALD